MRLKYIFMAIIQYKRIHYSDTLLYLTFSDMESELERDREREAEREKQRAKERADTQCQQLEERRQREQAEIEAKQVSENERKKLLSQHECNMNKLEKSLADEEARSQNALDAKLNARRNKRKAGEQARIEKEDILREEERKRAELLAEMQAQGGVTPTTSSKQQQVQKDTPTAPASGPFTPSASGTGAGEQDWMAMLMASPLFQQINDIHEMLEKNSGPGMGPDFVIGKISLWSFF